MIFKILHTTAYTYSGPVFLEPHYLRFRPRNTPHTRVLDFTLGINPEPAGISGFTDPEDNHAMFCWFENSHRVLEISASATVEVTAYNPFNFLVHPSGYLQLPFSYPPGYGMLLSPALQDQQLSDPVREFVSSALKKTGNQTIPFLTELTGRIHAGFTVETRETGAPLPPDHTFGLKKGSCRDLAWMQVHMLRHLGIASRFVSGYYYLDGGHTEFELHAWVEAYIPGAGWIGLDPAHGLAAGWNHIAVAASAFPEHTMPVTGSIRGSASSSLRKELSITPIDPIKAGN